MFHFLPSIEVKFKRGVKRGSFGARGVDEIKPSVRLGWMHPDMRQRVRAALLDFYDTHARLLPFRGEKDPYAIWLSEIMAQQTRIETLIPYFERFIERFPTIESLAHASEDEVLSLWSGLGYYRRAKLLHECAKILARDHGGEMPRDAAARLALPGIGRYTAGAIGSIAFDLEEPIVDGNVTRVLSRLRGWEELIGSAALEKKLWTEAEALVRGPRPGDLNQAMMELGATVCVPRSPACSECPIDFACTAQKNGNPEAFPSPRKRKRPRKEKLFLLLAFAEGDRLLLQKSEGSLFSGLFMPPYATDTGDPVGDRDAALSAFGVRSEAPPRKLGDLKHVLSHIIFEVGVYRIDDAHLSISAKEHARPIDELSSIGIGALTKKALSFIDS